MAFTSKISIVQAQTEYQHWVLTNQYSSRWGNYTYVEKPGFPVYIANGSVPIGQNCTIMCPLEAGHVYHVYCYGAWVNTGSTPKTDYDIYVYDPNGVLESEHTEAAGLPEHLGTTTNDAYFVPKSSGDYVFVINNDLRESQGSEQATFMIMEHIECDNWYSLYVQGKDGSSTLYNTNWAYEFLTNSSNIQVYVKVPDSLDMYEARLYLMSSANSIQINNVSLPIETGLYGNGTGIGGYNMDTDGYRGVAYASCEYHGQDMNLNYTATASSDLKVYHLVLMGETDSGTIQFLVKTSYNGTLTPLTTPTRVTPNDVTAITYISDTNTLESATLQYTTDGWTSTSQINMTINGKTCNATIPGQQAGTLVQYKIQACDVFKNNLNTTGSFAVRNVAEITDFIPTQITITSGNNITVTGEISIGSAPITVTYMSSNATGSVQCTSAENGSFRASFNPNGTGIFVVQAIFLGNSTFHPCSSDIIQVTVNEPTFIAKYGVYIGIGFIGGLSSVGSVLYVKKRRQ